MRGFLWFSAVVAGSLVSALVAPFGPTTSLLLPLVLFVAPGMVLLPVPPRLSWSYWTVAHGASCGVMLLALVGARVMGLALTAPGAWAAVAALVLVAFLRRGALDSLGRLVREAWAAWPKEKVAVMAVAFLLSYAACRWVVPPQQDQDMVVANPTYGYLQHGKPYGTETHFAYIFSKPPLLHLQAGAVLLCLDRLDQARFYWQSGRIVELLGEPRWATRLFRQRDIESFELHPELVWGARHLTTFYATFVPILMAEAAMALGGSWSVAMAASVAYVTMPEVFVRAGYAGFTTPSNALLALSTVLLVGGSSMARFVAGACLALLNQKTLFVPVAFVLWKVARPRKGVGQVIREPWLWGLAAGTSLWWAYGASVNWSTFLRDHFYYDFRDRFLFQDITLGTRGQSWYPGIAGLWLEWVRNWSPPLFLLGVAGICWALTTRGTPRFLALWALVGWVLGSVTDWRQTKHLMLTIVPMVVSAQLLSERLGWRRLLAVVGGASVAYNLARILLLWKDFDSLKPSTVW